MLVIRFHRTGRKKTPFYWLVVTEKSNAAQGKFLEKLGHYSPLSPNKDTVFNQERIEYWMSVGAIPSQTVARLCVKNGLKTAEKYIKQRTSKPSKAEVEAQEKAKKEAEEAEEKARQAAEAKAAAAEAASEESAKEESAEDGESEAAAEEAETDDAKQAEAK